MNTHTITDNEAAKLTELAYSLTIDSLIKHGNTPSEPHKKAIHGIVEAFTNMAQGKLKGRWAFGLAAGLGKSTCAVCWIAALIHLGYEDRVSVAVAVEEITSMEDLWKALDNVRVDGQKVNMEKVGVHFYKDKAASIRPTPDYRKRPVLLICHARVRERYLDQFNMYNDQPRSLLIYDESLIATYSQSCETMTLSGIAGAMAQQCLDHPSYRESRGEFSQFMTTLNKAVQAELARLEDIGATQSVIRLPYVSKDKLDQWRELEKGNNTILDLLDMAGHPVKITRSEQGLVSFQVSVPSEVKNICILDASDPIRDLVDYDRSIRAAEEELPSMGEAVLGCRLSAIKRYDNVLVFRMPCGGGKSTLYNSFVEERRERRRVCREVVYLVKNVIAKDEGILVVVFKPMTTQRGTVKFEETLKADLQAAGVNLDETIPVEDWKDGVKVTVQKPRIRWTTWGRHTATNDYSYCRNEIQVGVLQRSLLDLSGTVSGQAGDLGKETTRRELERVRLSEAAHCCYQAINRIACRSVDRNQAKAAKVWLIYSSEALEKKMSPVLQGGTWLEWKRQYNDDPPKPGQIQTAVKIVREYLSRLAAEGVEDITSRRLRKQTNTGVGDTAWKDVVKLATEGTEWRKVEHHVLRGETLFKASFPDAA